MAPRRKTPPPSSAAKPAWRRLSEIALWPAVIGFAVIVLPALAGRSAPPDDWTPPSSGYERLVNDLFVPMGWIDVSYAPDGQAQVDLSARVKNDARLARFVNNSYLRLDFADADLWRLTDDGDLVQGLDPFAHAVQRPFTAPMAWTGDILFAREGGEVFTLRADAGRALRLTSAASTVSPECAVNIDTGQMDADATGGVALVCATGPDGGLREAARFIVAGDQILIRVENTLAEVRVGRDQAVVSQDAGMALIPLDVGEMVSFEHAGHSLEMSVERGARSVSHFTDGRRLDFAGLTSLSTGLSAAMSERVRRNARLDATTRAQSGQPVRLSLDGELQLAAQTALEHHARRLQGDGGEAFPAMVTLMDGLTGEVLAMATYPASADDLSIAQRRTRRGDRLVEQNQNLRRHVVGSTAKAPLAMAVVDADPTLATLEINPGTDQGFRTLLGVDLNQTVSNHRGEGGLMTFTRFLARSNNRYALALMMLGFGERTADELPARDAGETWRLNGRERRDVPRLPLFGANDKRGEHGWIPRLPATFTFPWGARLEALFGVAAQQAPCPVAVTLWRGLGVPAQDCESPFARVSPESEYLGLNTIAELTPDYLMSILGGARSTWTTIKLAEAYSRIVTGRAIQARLTPVTDPDADAAGPLPTQSGARELVLDGLGQVVRNGTASALLKSPNPLADPDAYAPGVVLYGKTGTANVDPPTHRSPVRAALNNLARANCGLRWDPERSRLYIGGAPDAAGEAEHAAALAGLPQARCQAIVKANGAARIAKEMGHVRCVRPRAYCRPEGVAISAGGFVTAVEVGRVVSGAVERDETGAVRQSTSHAFVGSLVAPSIGRPRVLTIAVNLLKRTDQTRTPALDVTRSLLEDRAVQAWMRRDLPATSEASDE